jgi:hypothetical protein
MWTIEELRDCYDYEMNTIRREMKKLRKKPPSAAIDTIRSMNRACTMRIVDVDVREPERLNSITLFDHDDADEVAALLFDKSLTHRILFGCHRSIYIAESEDHFTNIDADSIALILKKVGVSEVNIQQAQNGV